MNQIQIYIISLPLLNLSYTSFSELRLQQINIYNRWSFYFNTASICFEEMNNFILNSSRLHLQVFFVLCNGFGRENFLKYTKTFLILFKIKEHKECNFTLTVYSISQQALHGQMKHWTEAKIIRFLVCLNTNYSSRLCASSIISIV